MLGRYSWALPRLLATHATPLGTACSTWDLLSGDAEDWPWASLCLASALRLVSKMNSRCSKHFKKWTWNGRSCPGWGRKTTHNIFRITWVVVSSCHWANMHAWKSTDRRLLGSSGIPCNCFGVRLDEFLIMLRLWYMWETGGWKLPGGSKADCTKISIHIPSRHKLSLRMFKCHKYKSRSQITLNKQIALFLAKQTGLAACRVHWPQIVSGCPGSWAEGFHITCHLRPFNRKYWETEPEIFYVPSKSSK